MKTFFTSLLTCFIGLMIVLPLSAQDAIEGNYEYMRNETAPGLSIVILGQPKNVEEVIENIFREMADERTRSRKGMMAIEKARFSPISAEEYNYYFTTESPSRRDDEHTEIHMFIADQEENFITSVNHPRTIANAKIWLADLEMETKVYEMSLVIEDQRKVLERSMAEEEDLEKDSVGLEQDLIDLRERMAENRQELIDQRAEVASEQAELQAFEAKLRALREEREILREARRRAETILDSNNRRR